MSFDVSYARKIAEPQVGPPAGTSVWNILARLLLEACDEIDRLKAEHGWPEPAPLPPTPIPPDYADSAE